MITQILTIALISYSAFSQKQEQFPFTLYNNDIPLDVRLQILNITNNQNCTTSSPINQIKYNNTKLTEVKIADFCTDYSSRTCCSNENLNALRLQFYRQVYQNQDLSLDCQQVLQKLICYDCDGDVGQGLRKGICQSQCEVIYDICMNDFFIIDQNTQGIKVCSRSDIMCSKLKDIVKQKTDFCKLLGHEINPNNDYEEWFYQFYAESNEQFLLNFNPVCWNFIPSGSIFGPAFTPLNPNPNASKQKKPDPKNPFERFNNKYSTIITILYIVLGVMVFLIICCIAYYCIAMRNPNKGRRHHID